MDFDFAALLVLLTFLTGIVWAIDAWIFAPRRKRGRPVWVEYCRSAFPVILAVLVFRSFIIEPFRIPSSSMMPTLLVGDFILVNKSAYGVRLPVVNWQIIETGEPERGDVPVFRYPNNPEVDYIKRVVGLPGDRIAYHNDILYINGEVVEQDILGRYVAEGSARLMTGASLRREYLGDGAHKILLMPTRPGRGSGEWVVPEGYYFMMGDNRENSNDSRFWGPVAEKYLVGEAFMIWMHWDPASGGIGWSRIGEPIN